MDKWLYVDAGKFNGLTETWNEAIKYPLYTEAPGEESSDYIIAGPTCDSQDVMYEHFRNPLPNGVKEGDRVYWFSTGAYTSSYASVEFNGFEPLPCILWDSAPSRRNNSRCRNEGQGRNIQNVRLKSYCPFHNPYRVEQSFRRGRRELAGMSAYGSFSFRRRAKK